MFETLKRDRELKNNEKLLDDEHYLVDENGNGIIDVGAETYSDIFSYYSLNGYNVLDSEFNSFLEAKADIIPMRQNLALHFHIKNADEEKLLEIKKAVRDNYEREIHAINRQMHKNSLFSLNMLLIGFGVFLFYIIFCLLNFNFIIKIIAEIGTWVFLWEAVDSFFLERRRLKMERLKKYRLMRSHIEVKEFVIKKIEKPKKITKS